MDFVAPGCFGRLSEFEMDYPDDLEGAQALEPILSPIMIRRRVTDVAQDLPDRIDVAQVLQMSVAEVNAYEDVREKILESFNGENATLPMLQKLRMYCTHPLLIDESADKNPVLSSGKYERLCEILEEIILLKEKVILFTSYNRMFEILQDDIPKRFGIEVMAINGSTPTDDRQPIIDRFSDITGTALLVLNPRAAGAGLNITAASRVIHYNLEWNPSLEDQASARAYRRGQTKTVFVYRLYYKDTVEEIINERIDKKRDMFGAAVVGTDGKTENSEDIIRALMISPGGDQNG
jgi:SNF2 family DNA or RNA helicase